MLDLRVWVPTKDDIERLLRDAADRLRSAQRVSDIERELSDVLVSLECHVINRANVEKGKINNE